ncbi:type II toxin-antitoxin system ParD family antitoxin [Blastopirellula sp. J2-11]|uniref:type II toxin-antitoxin system ParD family antitoxin n=1 Tax=Blastopirellula sp. J2-11 TaxID=2943192 RepID=UPI0021C81B65|nr:type II toxin-antitoxin system ParD family antitoxin [Blastopirellula sp. J2-11]UUO06688.1 type II toxin-antitoxin system ParD family antitoxin [Blastopirellula sp. J2-11]
MPTRNINLTEQYDQFVQRQIESGAFKNASEVLRAGLRLLQQQSATEEQKLALLKQLAKEGFQSLDQGEGLTATSEKSLSNTIAKIGRRAAKSTPQRTSD